MILQPLGVAIQSARVRWIVMVIPWKHDHLHVPVEGLLVGAKENDFRSRPTCHPVVDIYRRTGGAGLLREGPSVSEDKYRCKEERDAAAYGFNSLRSDVKLLRTEGTFSFSRATARTGKFDSTSGNKRQANLLYNAL